MTLPAFRPDLAAALLGALPARLGKRAAALAEHAADWDVGVDGSACTVRLGAETVRLDTGPDRTVVSAEQVGCSCLVSPRCAHVGAVATAAPIADVPIKGAPGGEDPIGEAPIENSQSDSGQPSVLSDDEVQALAQACAALAAVLAHGAAHCGPVDYAALLAAVHRLRVVKLHSAGAGLTAVTEQVRRFRLGDDAADRQALLEALVRAALAIRRLGFEHEQGRVSDDARGFARRRYRPVGNLDLLPLICEPVIADTGYTGVVTSFADAAGTIWTVPVLAPVLDDADPVTAVAAAYRQPARFAGAGLPVRELARRRLMISAATASASGRLGAGKGVQAVSSTVTDPDACWQRLPVWSPAAVSGLYRLVGETGTLDERPTIDGVPVRFSALAGRLDPIGLQLLTRAWGDRASTVNAVVRVGSVSGDGAPELLAVAAASLPLPEEWAGRFYPGLDHIPSQWFSTMTGVGRDCDPTAWPADAASGPSVVDDLVRRWLGRAAVQGRRALLAGAGQLEHDAGRARRLAAPLAADLLAGALAGARAGGQRFDGSWQYDDAALLFVLTRLAAYLPAPV